MFRKSVYRITMKMITTNRITTNRSKWHRLPIGCLLMLAAAPSFAQSASLLSQPAAEISPQATAAQASVQILHSEAVQNQPAQSQQNADSQLAYIAQDNSQSIANRAQALRDLAQYPSQNGLIAVARALKDERMELREAAIIGTSPYPVEHRWRMLSPLLDELQLGLRLDVTLNLIQDYQGLDERQKTKLEPHIAILRSHLAVAKDLESQWKLAESYRLTNNYEMALNYYQTLAANPPSETEFWLNYADIYRALDQDNDAIELLNKAMQVKPSRAKLHFAKALTLVRLDQKTEALEQVETAVKLSPSESHYWYVKGALYSELNNLKALNSFEIAYSLSNSPEHLYALCDAYVQHQHQQAKECIDSLALVAPKQVVDTIKSKVVFKSDS